MGHDLGDADHRQLVHGKQAHQAAAGHARTADTLELEAVVCGRPERIHEATAQHVAESSNDETGSGGQHSNNYGSCHSEAGAVETSYSTEHITRESAGDNSECVCTLAGKAVADAAKPAHMSLTSSLGITPANEVLPLGAVGRNMVVDKCPIIDYED